MALLLVTVNSISRVYYKPGCIQYATGKMKDNVIISFHPTNRNLIKSVHLSIVNGYLKSLELEMR